MFKTFTYAPRSRFWNELRPSPRSETIRTSAAWERHIGLIQTSTSSTRVVDSRDVRRFVFVRVLQNSGKNSSLLPAER